MLLPGRAVIPDASRCGPAALPRLLGPAAVPAAPAAPLRPLRPPVSRLLLWRCMRRWLAGPEGTGPLLHPGVSPDTSCSAASSAACVSCIRTVHEHKVRKGSDSRQEELASAQQVLGQVSMLFQQGIEASPPDPWPVSVLRCTMQPPPSSPTTACPCLDLTVNPAIASMHATHCACLANVQCKCAIPSTLQA